VRGEGLGLRLGLGSGSGLELGFGFEAGDAGMESGKMTVGGGGGGSVGRRKGGRGVERVGQEWRKGSGWWDYMWMEDIREGEEEEGVG